MLNPWVPMTQSQANDLSIAAKLWSAHQFVGLRHGSIVHLFSGSAGFFIALCRVHFLFTSKDFDRPGVRSANWKHVASGSSSGSLQIFACGVETRQPRQTLGLPEACVPGVETSAAFLQNN